jgi:hypothetical protein
MAETEKLKRFHVEQQGDGFLLSMEDETGATFAVLATHDQLDLIADNLDDALDADEEAESVDEDEDDDKD